jgi:hypothetical protein
MNLSARSTKSFTLIVVFFLFFIACSQCMASDQILGKWLDTGDGTTTEFLSDGYRIG